MPYTVTYSFPTTMAFFRNVFNGFIICCLGVFFFLCDFHLRDMTVFFFFFLVTMFYKSIAFGVECARAAVGMSGCVSFISIVSKTFSGRKAHRRIESWSSCCRTIIIHATVRQDVIRAD